MRNTSRSRLSIRKHCEKVSPNSEFGIANDSGYANGDIQTTPDVATAKMELDEENYLMRLPDSRLSDSPSSSQFTCPSDCEGCEHCQPEESDADEEVPDLEEIEYSTDNSSEIDGWEAPTHHSSYRRMMSLFEFAQEEELDSKIEFVAHKMKGFPGRSGTRKSPPLINRD
jgi:hypothetical protein